MADGTNHLSSHDADNKGQRQKPEQEKETETGILAILRLKQKELQAREKKKILLSPWPLLFAFKPFQYCTQIINEQGKMGRERQERGQLP